LWQSEAQTGEELYVHKHTTELSARDCRDLKRACTQAREIGRSLNTLATFVPYPGLLPSPEARANDLNRFLTHIRGWMKRKLDEAFVALWVWHSDVTGRNPHVHVFMHCPPRQRDELNSALVANYPAGVIDVSEGGDIRKPHPSGYWGSTLDYLMRFKSQQAFVADGGKTWRASTKLTILDGRTGRLRTVNRGIKSPITGKRWGCTRNISARAIDTHQAAKAKSRAWAAVYAARRRYGREVA
jgi:hypothetical protein